MAKKDKNSLLNIHYSRTMTSDNLSKAANYVGEYFLKGIGTLGKFLNAGFTSPTYGTTGQVSYARNAEDAKRLREQSEASEQAVGKAMTWVSPLNYGTALWNGHGLDARKGEEEVSSWSPAWQAVGRLGELYVGPKVVKGVKAAPRVVVNTAAKAGVKPAKAAVVVREIKLATKNKPNIEVSKPIIRTRVGDVEINNPQLFYRQGSAEMGNDFIKSGVVKTSGGFLNPMYTEGALFKKIPTRTKGGLSKGDKIALEGPYNKTKSDLIVTDSSVDMIPADQGSGKNYTWFEDYMLDPFAEESIFDKSRVPLFNGTATSANTTAYRWEPGYGYKKVVQEPSTSLKFFERKPSTIQISPEELYKVFKDQELNGYYFMGHGTGRTNVNPLVIFDNGLRIKNGDIGNTTSPISLSSLSLWPHSNSKEVIILPGKAENVRFDSARGRIPSDWYDSKTFQWNDNPGFEGSGFFAVLKPNATFIETEINGVPGVYTKPGAILGSYNIDTLTLRLNPNSQYKFQFGTPQIAEKNVVNKIPNIIRTVLDNGKKIRLSLPSHTDSNPRQFVLEPQGNNKFYVHMRTWDGDHIPANLTNAEKQQLFNALYNELPEGAEILFPKSGPGNYGTRGTVAGLQRLSRDPRFTPGTKGILQYYDKDGKTIKTYEGTSFIKSPKLQYLKQGGKMNILEFLKNGSGIHIKEKNKGKFTSYCGGKVTDECILKGKNSSNPAIRKRATFAANARKWKHKEGGIIKALGGSKVNWLSIASIGGTLLNTYLLNKKVDSQAKAALAEEKVDLSKTFFDLYQEGLKKAALLEQLLAKAIEAMTGTVTNASPISILNNAYRYASAGYGLKKSEQDLKNALIKALADAEKFDNTTSAVSGLILNGLRMISDYYNNNKSSSSSYNNPSYFSNYVNNLFKNYGTFNSDGSMNLGNGLGTISIKDGYKPRLYSMFDYTKIG